MTNLSSLKYDISRLDPLLRRHAICCMDNVAQTWSIDHRETRGRNNADLALSLPTREPSSTCLACKILLYNCTLTGATHCLMMNFELMVLRTTPINKAQVQAKCTYLVAALDGRKEKYAIANVCSTHIY